jgi:hypothetical protein
MTTSMASRAGTIFPPAGPGQPRASIDGASSWARVGLTPVPACYFFSRLRTINTTSVEPVPLKSVGRSPPGRAMQIFSSSFSRV